MKFYFIFLLLLSNCISNGNKETINIKSKDFKVSRKLTDTSKTLKISNKLYSKNQLTKFRDSDFVIFNKIDTTFFYDMRYATLNNFLKEQVYDCDNCLVRYKTAKQLLLANNSFKKLGYRIKFFDCYRPLSIQKKMWKIFPDKRYVANPIKGSNHNRGSAVDITLVDVNGIELDMGTTFDFFGIQAHHNYTNFPKQIIENRKLLKSIMENNGFTSITSEWWHYDLLNSYKYKVSDFKAECN